MVGSRAKASVRSLSVMGRKWREVSPTAELSSSREAILKATMREKDIEMG
jgi:hypothetical protein